MRMPDSISKAHIAKALKQIDGQSPRYPAIRKSTTYDLHYGGRVYPPKWVVVCAYKLATGADLHGIKGGSQTNNFLIARGFWRIWNKKTKKRISIKAESEDYGAAYPEGTKTYAWHRKLERNSKIAQRAKNERSKHDPNLRCDVCGFSFMKSYGPRGVGFIEAHHIIPLSIFKKRKPTKIQDFALVCSNCHRMLHYGPSLLSVDELRSSMKASGTGQHSPAVRNIEGK